ncbi:MAG: hypothetical protein ABJG15_06490 [Hyphomonadaceae bacterium]
MAQAKIVRLHKIVGLVFGIQLVFWTLSGLFFTLFPIEQVRGENLRIEIDHGELDMAAANISTLHKYSDLDARPDAAELKMFLGTPVWKLSGEEGTHLIDAQTGETLSPISKQSALEIATLGMSGKAGTPGEPWLIEGNAPREYTGPLPVWAVDFEPGTVRAYIDGQTGELRTVRTRLWRTFDALWRFHIMDVTGANRIDSWWLKIAAFFGLTLALSGLVLGIDALRKGRAFK